jgi:asparagine synthase (glutamine-hydrolysing)
MDEQAAALRLAFERQMSDDLSVGLFLSGGLDSRQLAGAMPARGDKFHTFSRGPAQSWDIKFAKMVAEQVGSRHHTLDLQPGFLAQMADRGVWLTDGLMTVIDIYILSVIQTVKQHADVVMFGMGPAAHVLSGIALNKPLLEARTTDEAAQAILASQGVYLPQELQKRLLPARFTGELRTAMFETLRRTVEAFQVDSPAGLGDAYCVQCRWPRSSGYGPLLARTQVETRSPYSDPDLLAAASRLPPAWRMKRRMQIALLKHTRPDLARLPWEFTGLPVDISTPTVMFIQRGLYFARRWASRWTHGLIPAGTERERANYPVWFRTGLRPWLEGLLLDPRTLERGLFNPDVVRQMVSDHMDGRQNYSTQFGLLMTFEIWNRLFVDGDRPPAAPRAVERQATP